MPDKYHIKTVATAGRFRRVGKYGNIDYREDCSRCSNCVKLRCVYDTYRKESAHAHDPATSIQPLYECRACFSCVQGCTKGLLSLGINPEYLDMGDEYWKPDIMDTTWKQADTGRIPVSGAGYRGRFHGPGFDSIWTDMSEIVRPTRDGIHGREYISTSVDIGPKPMRLRFGPHGELLGELAQVIEIQIPAILDIPPWEIASKGMPRARLLAARALRSLAVLDAAAMPENLPPDLLACAVPLLSGPEVPVGPWLDHVRLVEIADGPGALATAQVIRERRADVIVCLRLPMRADRHTRIIECAQAGIKVFQLCADLHGREPMGSETGLAAGHIKDVMRRLHGALVTAGLRDEVTLIVGGGIALAEHMAKAIICGADLVAVDAALLVAIGCRICQEKNLISHENHCPAEMDSADADYAAQRFVNLLGAWHSQLIEVLGAMGIREIRRLRGEVGRAIFMEDIEREAFGDLARKHQ
jgi:hypothetical protein